MLDLCFYSCISVCCFHPSQGIFFQLIYVYLYVPGPVCRPEGVGRGGVQEQQGADGAGGRHAQLAQGGQAVVGGLGAEGKGTGG